MVEWAYSDASKRNVVKAQDLHGLRLGADYYCPGRDCPAVMSLHQGNGALGVAAYFGARPSTPHDSLCLYSSGVARAFGVPKPFERRYIDEANFDLARAIDMLMSPSTGDYAANKSASAGSISGKAGKTTLRLKHISQIYLMLKQMDVDDVFAGMNVGQMLCDERSQFTYHKQMVYGGYICECHRDAVHPFYNSKKGEIRLRVDVANGQCVRLRFDDIDKFWSMERYIYENTDRKVIVAGNWQFAPADDDFRYDALACDITCDRQYFLCSR